MYLGPEGSSEFRRIKFDVDQDSLHLDDSHVVTFKVDQVGSKTAHIDYAEEISAPRYKVEFHTLLVIDQCAIRHWFCAIWNVLLERLVAVDKEWGLLVPPIANRHHNIFIEAVEIRYCCIVHNQGATEAIEIRSSNVRVIPVSTCLRSLFANSLG